MTPSICGKFPVISSLSPSDTMAIGAVLAEHLFPGLLILLSGDLGAGKTALTQSIGGALGVKGIKSPTFTIESIYKLPGREFSMIHADLYRLEDNTHAVMQFEEYIEDGDLLLVEWGERWAEPPAENRWDIGLSRTGETTRAIDLVAYGDAALHALSAAFTAIIKWRKAGTA